VSARASAWVALLAAPTAWLTMLLVVYALVPRACHTGHDGALWATVIVTFAAALAGLPLARRAQAGAAPSSSAYAFLAKSAYWTSLAFVLAIAITALPLLVLPACR
jgi:hypothetical protein